MLRLLLRQFASPIMLILIGATLISITVDDSLDGLIILVIVVVSGVLGFFQEYRADETMKKLAALVQIHAEVRRDGQEMEIPPDQVVIGDVVVLRAGDIIPADLRIIQAHGLLVDEASVTGESLPVEKGLTAPSGTLPVDRAFYGTHVVSGTGEGVVEAIGAQTRFGAVVASLAQQETVTSFEREMTQFGYLLTKVMAVLMAAVLIVQALAARPLIESVMFALALAVGITPQMLPAILIFSLAAGARRMAADGVLIRRLDVIEDLGSMSVLCADKTGTLTAGAVSLQSAVDLAGAESEHVLQLAATNASLQTSYANALDQAIMRVRTVQGRALAEIPYDFERRRMSVLVNSNAGSMIVTKGAVASILDICTAMRRGNAVVELDGKEVEGTVRRLGEQGLRVLAVATKSSSTLDPANESEMVLEGLITFLDPPTASGAEAIVRLRELDVDVVLISGDNRYVTQAVASAVGLDVTRVVTGAELETMSADDLLAAVRVVKVFAEVQPLQKGRVVSALRAAGETVGFLGDGINDVVALRAADAGISVQAAADVAKQSAAMVINSPDLHAIADAVLMGRRTFANTLKYIQVTISANFGNVISMVVASMFLPFLPMLPVQILLLNLLSDAPALTIAADSVEDDVLKRPHVWSLEAIRRFMIVFGLISSIIDVTAFVILRTMIRVDASLFHTAWFLLSLLTEVIALLVLRSRGALLRSRPAPSLLAVSFAVLAVASLAVALGWGVDLGLAPLNLPIWAMIGLLGLAYLAINEIAKRTVGVRYVWAPARPRIRA